MPGELRSGKRESSTRRRSHQREATESSCSVVVALCDRLGPLGLGTRYCTVAVGIWSDRYSDMHNRCMKWRKPSCRGVPLSAFLMFRGGEAYRLSQAAPTAQRDEQKGEEEEKKIHLIKGKGSKSWAHGVCSQGLDVITMAISFLWERSPTSPAPVGGADAEEEEDAATAGVFGSLAKLSSVCFGSTMVERCDGNLHQTGGRSCWTALAWLGRHGGVVERIRGSEDQRNPGTQPRNASSTRRSGASWSWSSYARRYPQPQRVCST